MAESVVPPSSDVYYTGKYWNDRVEVREHLNRRATDDASATWWQQLAAWRGRPFERVLSLNCGSGWVERDLVQHNVAKSAVGVEVAEDLLVTARAAADEMGLDITYVQADANQFSYDLEGVDCVVNHAAAHHLAYIDRVFRRVAYLLPPDGVFVSWDYTGPPRNQYSAEQWEAMHELNANLPEHLRKDLQYPHLPTMLLADPTEAIHSDLILPVMHRYFELQHLRHLGGGLAYELLTFNDAFFDGGDTADWIERILAADAAYTDADPERRSLFTYVIATPRATRHSGEQLAAWTTEEDERERTGARNGGRYHPDSVIGALTQRLESIKAREAERDTSASARGGPFERLGRRTDAAARRVRAKIRRRLTT